MYGQEDARKLRELIRQVPVAMLASVERDGTLRARPMAAQTEEFDGRFLWFFTDEHTAKVDEVRHDPRICVCYADPRAGTYVSVTGHAQLVRDRQRIHELWNEGLRSWFQNGPDDPALALLRVEVLRAEYWDSAAGKLVPLSGLARVALTGRPA